MSAAQTRGEGDEMGHTYAGSRTQFVRDPQNKNQQITTPPEGTSYYNNVRCQVCDFVGTDDLSFDIFQGLYVGTTL